MALEAVVFPQDPFGYNKDLFNFWYNSSPTSDPNCNELHHPDDRPSSVEGVAEMHDDVNGGDDGGGRRRPERRRRRKSCLKNEEEIEKQRMTHIVVERNRRKQMNEYLSVLRSLMPDSYVQRGDQASIIGSAINFVKELEHQVHLLSAHVVGPIHHHHHNNYHIPSPFSHFLSFPRFSSPSSPSSSLGAPVAMASDDQNNPNNPINQFQSSAADVEVSVVDSHANLKIKCRKLPKLLLKIVSGLNSLRLSVLHLNVSSAQQIMLYSFSLKVEEDCGLSSGDEIARAVHQLLCRIHEESFSN